MTRLHLEAVVAQLTAMGWTALNSTAIASKTYDTAVGPKTALAYLGHRRQDDPNISLTGDYQSEGRNVLEPRGVLLPVDADDATVRRLAEKFGRDADHAISESYAARLLKS